ncbi:L,D-transpeptidase family protein [Roseovarius sp. SCSIO 43702]|nr:L,D-transpeptidase family protein [Roseovarius sp. SCSIO 43702]
MRWLIRAMALTLLLLVAVAVGRHLLAPVPPAPPVPLPPLTGTIDLIELDKSERRLTVYRDGEALRSYEVALGPEPEGHKRRQGDGRTPEGEYRIDRRNPQSAFHLSLGIDYPRPQDRARAAEAGVSPGGDIFFHGQPNLLPHIERRAGDWTEGCIALTNAEIEELWRVTPIGTRVVIRP